jgi:enolase-phosphatase E1
VSERFRARAVLTDIEGTTGSVAFVKDVLFPYADAHLDEYVAFHATVPEVAAVLSDAAREAGVDAADRTSVLAALHSWIARDAKITALKTLQGMIWAQGYACGELKGHVYDDAARALRTWHAAGLRLYVYSSGSVEAQKSIFGHSVAGDLRPLFSGYFDTTTGNKRESASYERIAATIGIQPKDILFLSDSVAELDVAARAHMQTAHIARPTDGTAPTRTHPSVTTFDDLTIDLTESR